MTTKNLKIFHDLNRLDTEEKKAAREAAIAAKEKKAVEAQALEDSGHARAIIGGEVREPRPEPEEPIAVPEPEPEPEKIACDICNNEFSPQGYPKHREACEKRKALEEKKAQLEAELQGIDEE